MIVRRPALTWYESLYFPSIVAGLAITFKHLRKSVWRMLFPRHDAKPRTLLDMSVTGLVTMEYPEEKWPMPEGYRGAPTLVRDEEGREKCVSCQLCEFVCPPRAIRIKPGEIATGSRFANVEKAPQEFDIDMLRCIYCGLCEEVCPEEAIFLSRDFPILTSYDRQGIIHNKQKLYEMGGVKPRPIHKWAGK